MTTFTLFFAVFLCLINAVLWMYVSHMPMASMGWILAAGACVWLRKWTFAPKKLKLIKK
jgi:hypothetical protein